MSARTLILALCLLASTAWAEPPSDIDTEGFKTETAAALTARSKRILSSDAFLEMLARDDVLLLDTRSAWAFRKSHIQGAVHLNFSDFSEGKLAKLIPSKTTTILIYCNNNLVGDPMAYAHKFAPMALNIPTFINLYGYGYKNVYELGALVNIRDGRFAFGGTAPTGLPGK